MCGIVGIASNSNCTNALIEGLKKLAYRGYDSAGLATLVNKEIVKRVALGKIGNLETTIKEKPIEGNIGIAHTRWATHGSPNELNAHPHATNQVAIVHNGIIENYKEIRTFLSQKNINCVSDTDSEVLVQLISYCFNGNLEEAVSEALKKVVGAYGILVISNLDPEKIVAARCGSPIVVGIGKSSIVVASDPSAIRPHARDVIYLEDYDLAVIDKNNVSMLDIQHSPVSREITAMDWEELSAEKGKYEHFMLKEIYEQPQAVLNTLDGRIGGEDVLENIFGQGSSEIFAKVKRIQIIACGTSLHAGRVAANWFSAISGLPTQLDYASEYRYKNPYVDKDTLLVTISQSGETADTLAALRYAADKGYLASLSICNVPTSSLARESDFLLLTNAGPEIGVASTKAFTTQLTALMLLTLSLAKAAGKNPRLRARMIKALRLLPEKISEALKLKNDIIDFAPEIANKDNALFLGRGIFYPIAKEGALKLKEISYIHAEAYPAGELKHGPLALIDEEMPVVAIAPEYELAEKLVSNLEEVKARGGALYVFGNAQEKLDLSTGRYISMPECDFLLTPILYSIPLQILSYEVALLRGTDIDQPRNLAKSVTVE